MTKNKVVGTPKNGKARPVVISQDLAAELLEYFAAEAAERNADAESFVFAGKDGRTGKLRNDVPQSRWRPAEIVRAACKRADLVDEKGKPLTTPHGLRATGATLASRAGVNPFIIQHQLGHAELRTTQESYLGPPPPELLADYAKVFG